MTWQQRKLDPDKPEKKISPKQSLQREWFVRQGQILAGFHCMHSAALQLGDHYFAAVVENAKNTLLYQNNEWFKAEKDKVDETK